MYLSFGQAGHIILAVVKARSHLVGGPLEALVTLHVPGFMPIPAPAMRPFQVEVVPDLLTILSDALGAVALIVGAVFAYYKFLKGRVIGAPAGLELRAAMVPHHDQRQFVRHRRSPGALVVEVGIRNNGLPTVRVPKDSVQLVSISSITEHAATRAGPGLSQEALSWKRPDAYWAQANILLDEGQAPKADITLRQGQILPLAAVFPVPSEHCAVAFLVVLNSQVESGWWFRRRLTCTEMRKLVLPGRPTWPGGDEP